MAEKKITKSAEISEPKKPRKKREPKVVEEKLVDALDKLFEEPVEEPVAEKEAYTVIYTHGINLRTQKPADVNKTFGEGNIIVVMPYSSKFIAEKSEGKWLYGTFENEGKTYEGWACGNGGIWLKKV